MAGFLHTNSHITRYGATFHLINLSIYLDVVFVAVAAVVVFFINVLVLYVCPKWMSVLTSYLHLFTNRFISYFLPTPLFAFSLNRIVSFYLSFSLFLTISYTFYFCDLAFKSYQIYFIDSITHQQRKRNRTKKNISCLISSYSTTRFIHLSKRPVVQAL